MKILHLNTLDTGGAARALYRLHRELRRLTHNSYMFILKQKSRNKDIVAYKPSRDFISRIRRRLRREIIDRSFNKYNKSISYRNVPFSDDRTPYCDNILDQIPAYDVINLHWIAGFIDYKSFFFRFPKKVPIVWRLADMNSFTGGCHYDFNCGRYKNNCGACPHLGSKDPTDLSYQILKRKKKIINKLNEDQLNIVATSRWIASEAKSSSLFHRFPITIIPNGLDTEDFAPRERSFSRDVLSIPRESKIILFAANNARYKGLSILLQAINNLKGIDNIFLLSFGSSEPQINNDLPHLHLGYITNDRFLSIIYSSADVYVIPSIQESFGQTVTEAMSCGTPIIGFDIGGVRDTVRSGVNGLLVPVGDVSALSETIIQLLNDSSERERMALNCRRIAVEEYSVELQAKRYIELYKKVCDID